MRITAVHGAKPEAAGVIPKAHSEAALIGYRPTRVMQSPKTGAIFLHGQESRIRISLSWLAEK
jgi:hypothetical protein